MLYTYEQKVVIKVLPCTKKKKEEERKDKIGFQTLSTYSLFCALGTGPTTPNQHRGAACTQPPVKVSSAAHHHGIWAHSSAAIGNAWADMWVLASPCCSTASPVALLWSLGSPATFPGCCSCGAACVLSQVTCGRDLIFISIAGKICVGNAAPAWLEGGDVRAWLLLLCLCPALGSIQ